MVRGVKAFPLLRGHSKVTAFVGFLADVVPELARIMQHRLADVV
jgi:hypothetical protein